MELRKALKSLVALGTGATLVGATVLSALAAASLSTYPAPFIKDGKFDALIVVGANAASIDTLGAIDIATSLQAANTVTKTVPGTGATVTVEGDAFRLDSGSDALEKGESIAAVGTTTLTDANLDALSGGKIVNAKGTATYQESISVNAATVDFAIDPDDTTDTPAWYLVLASGAVAYEYKVTFIGGLESDIVTGVLDDIEDKSITLLGKTYNIINADGTGAGVTLDLMAGSAKDTIAVGETKTYSVGDKDYEVTLTYAESNKAKFTVNGVSTNLITAGDTDVLSDGTELGLSEVLYQPYAGGIQSAEFYIGATKIRLADTDISAGVGSDVVVGSNTVGDVTTTIGGTNTSNTVKINTITLTWTTDEDYYIPVNGKLSGKAKDDEMFLNFDVEFKGIQEDSDKDTIELVPSGDDEYKLKFTNKEGNVLSVPIADTDTLDLRRGDELHDLLVAEGVMNATGYAPASLIDKNDYFVVSSVASKNTYLLKYKGLDMDEGELTFDEVGSGTEITVAYTFTNNATKIGDLTLGGTDYRVYTSVNVDDNPILVDFDGDTVVNEATTPVWYTKYGARITSTSISTFTVEAEAGGDVVGTAAPTDKILVTITNSTVDNVDAGVSLNISLETIGDGNNQEDYSVWGTRVYKTYSESGPDKFTFTYPDDQTEMLVYYTSGATTSTSTSGGTTYQEVVPISVDAAVLDTEVADFSAQNLIIVGGPCVNAAAADVMGSPDVCTTGFVEGKAMIKLYERANGKIALLVAGYSGMDTRRASRAVAEYKKHVFVGTELEVTGTSLTQYTVTAAQ